MYIKFKVEDIEIELGGFDHAFDVDPFVNATVDAVTYIFKTGKVKELHDVIERFGEDDDCKKAMPNNNRTDSWTSYRTTCK